MSRRLMFWHPKMIPTDSQLCGSKPSSSIPAEQYDAQLLGDYQVAKSSFLGQNAQSYGYPSVSAVAPQAVLHQQGCPTAVGMEDCSACGIDALRATEFRRLRGQAYLDHGGSALYSETQLEASFRELSDTLLCNPHRWVRAPDLDGAGWVDSGWWCVISRDGMVKR